MLLFLQCVAESVAENGLRGLAELVPGGGAVFDIAKGAVEKYRQRCKDDENFQDIEKRLRHEIEQIGHAGTADVKKGAVEAAKHVPEFMRAEVEGYLEKIPALVQQSMKRPEDPTGKSLPANFPAQSAESVAKLLPPPFTDQLPDGLRKIYMELKKRAENFGPDVQTYGVIDAGIFRAAKRFAEFVLVKRKELLHCRVRPEGFSIPERESESVFGLTVKRLPDTHGWSVNHEFDIGTGTDIDAVTKLLRQSYEAVRK